MGYKLSLDLSTKSSGYAIFDEEIKLIDSGIMTSEDKDAYVRIAQIGLKLKDVLLKYPTVNRVIIEEVLPDKDTTLFKNAYTQRILMYMQATAAMLIHQYLPAATVEFIYPTQWRRMCGIFTGRGIVRDDLKPQDIKFANQIFNLQTTSDDEADAVCLGWAVLTKGTPVQEKEKKEYIFKEGSTFFKQKK